MVNLINQHSQLTSLRQQAALSLLQHEMPEENISVIEWGHRVKKIENRSIRRILYQVQTGPKCLSLLFSIVYGHHCDPVYRGHS